MAIAISTEESNLESSLDQVSSESSGELELSCGSSPFESDNDSGPEGIHLFLYEPSASSSENEGSDSDVEDFPRLINLNW